MLRAFTQTQKQQQKRLSAEIPLPTLSKRPIIEHHVHAEGGTLEPEELVVLANRNGMPIPEAMFGPNNTLKFKDRDFFDFLSVYDQATSYILTPRDIQEVIYRYLRRCHQEGAVFVELTCSPDHVQKCRKTYKDVQEGLTLGVASSSHAHQDAGENISYAQFVNAVAAGIDQARQEFGIEARILMVLLRHNGKEAAMKTLDDMLAYRHPYVVGMNLAGDEENFPPALFIDCYTKAKRHGLKLTAHVGEHAGPEKIIEAVDLLGLDRVGHGVTAVRSELVMDFIRDRKIALELCPSSNLSLGLFPSLNEHPLRTFFDRGILFSINSDDPAFFGSSLGQEFQKV